MLTTFRHIFDNIKISVIKISAKLLKYVKQYVVIIIHNKNCTYKRELVKNRIHPLSLM